MSLKKLDIGKPYLGFFPQQMLRTNFEWLYPTDSHFAALVDLPLHHKDPFDRLIIAQAIIEQIPIISADALFDSYPVQRLW